MKTKANIKIILLLISIIFLYVPTAGAVPVNPQPGFCCCSLSDDPFGVGCISYVCSEENQFFCEQELGGTWNIQSMCNQDTGACEEYTAITLVSFKAVARNKKIIVGWLTETEIDNAGFNLYRAEKADGEYAKINNALIPARGSATQGAAYTRTDENVTVWKTYYYKLEDIDKNGVSTMHGPVSARTKFFSR